MKSWMLLALAAVVLCPWTATAVPMGGLPPQVCDGPAGASNPNCQPGDFGPPAGTPASTDAAVPEPGAAAAFALGAALVAARSRRR